MDPPPAARPVLALVISVALLLASGALLLTFTQGDSVSPLFGHVLTVQVILALVVWSLVAWGVRRLVIGKLPKMRLNSRAAFIWGGFRVALLIATVTLMVCWFAALALGLAAETAIVRAVVLLLVVTAFTGITAGASFNSMLVLKRWRDRRA